MGPIVKTLQGDIEGFEGQDLDGNTFYQFLGIPYAKPPVGDLRFKEPQPAGSWIGVRDATKDGDACYHKEEILPKEAQTKELYGSEDCLYLNVFTRNLPTDVHNLKPVMVWIHGGGFVSGSNTSKMYGPEFLLSDDVVLVTINYRLGLLGFLRIKDESFNVSGNMGLKDQVEALRWVKSNIQQFNGDPANVTLFGESAGAASVHYHVLSPLSRDLFHKAILQSGAALDPWADECDHSAVQIAKIHDPSISTEKEALKLFKNLSVDELYQLQVAFLAKIEIGATRPFGLVIEPVSKKTAFLTNRPIDIITSGDYNKIPMIFGYNSMEGLMFNVRRKLSGNTGKLILEQYLPPKVNLKNNRAVQQSYIEKLQNLYFVGPDEDANNSMLLSDAWFLAGIIGSVKNHSQTSAYPVYLYKLSLDTKLNFIKVALKLTHLDGCSHADDLGYLFKTFATPSIEPGSIEDVSLRRVVRLWTNFARFGNPTPDDSEVGLIWKPAMSRQLNTLHITEELRIEVNPEGNRMNLWRQIYHQSPATIKYL